MSFVPELNRKLRNASPNPGLAQQENSNFSITGESSGINALSSGTVEPIPLGYCSEIIAGTESSRAEVRSLDEFAIILSLLNMAGSSRS